MLEKLKITILKFEKSTVLEENLKRITNTKSLAQSLSTSLFKKWGL
jgi:hypothetical protein